MARCPIRDGNPPKYLGFLWDGGWSGAGFRAVPSEHGSCCLKIVILAKHLAETALHTKADFRRHKRCRFEFARSHGALSAQFLR